MSYRTIVGDGSANAAFTSADAVVPPVPEAPVFDMREEETYAAILERPLFSPTRRPASQSSASAAPAQSSNLALLGIAAGAGRTIALIRTETDAPAIKAQAGDEVAGWQLVTIAASAVTLERQGGQQLSLELPFKAPAPAVAPVIGATQPQEPELEPDPAAAEQPQQPEDVPQS
jgi:hypothetical protein